MFSSTVFWILTSLETSFAVGSGTTVACCTIERIPHALFCEQIAHLSRGINIFERSLGWNDGGGIGFLLVWYSFRSVGSKRCAREETNRE